MSPRTCFWAVAFVVGCGGEAGQSPARPEPEPAATSAAGSPIASAAPTAAQQPAASATQALAPTDAYRAERTLEADVHFFITGEGGRLAVLANEGGVIVPHRFESAKWEKLELPAAHRAAVADASLGIYFGRDNRPRLMGFRNVSGESRMVYLRFKDGSWRDERSEIGSLANDKAVLYGVLGEADPEVVCREGSICLLKSRKGWKEVRATIPKDANVRVFGGKGYALTADGVYLAAEGGFTKVGGSSPWKGNPSGFWVGADGSVVVAEASTNVLHVLDRPDAAWRKEASPIAGVRDVAGPASDRWLVGDGGIAHGDGSGWRRVGEAGWSLARVIVLADAVFFGGKTGVVKVTKAR